MVTVDIVLISSNGDDSEILLIERKNDPFSGSWALPGGFMDMEETTLAAAERELMEETGIKGLHLVMHGLRDDIHRDPRGRCLTVVFVCILEKEKPQANAGDDAKEVRWFPINALPQMAFDHSQIVEDVLQDYNMID